MHGRAGCRARERNPSHNNGKIMYSRHMLKPGRIIVRYRNVRLTWHCHYNFINICIFALSLLHFVFFFVLFSAKKVTPEEIMTNLRDSDYSLGVDIEHRGSSSCYDCVWWTVTEYQRVCVCPRTKDKRDNRASCVWYWILYSMPTEKLMNSIQRHANGYQGDFIPHGLRV